MVASITFIQKNLENINLNNFISDLTKVTYNYNTTKLFNYYST